MSVSQQSVFDGTMGKTYGVDANLALAILFGSENVRHYSTTLSLS
jgi:hypothetical protein